MTFKILTFEDRDIFRSCAAKSSLIASEVLFTNLFIWRSYYNIVWAETDGCLALIARPAGESPFGLPPLGGGDQLGALDFTAAALKELGVEPVFKRVPEALAKEAVEGGRPYIEEHDPDNDDYVYPAQQLITLSGRRMHQKKNHYNYFINHYRFETLPITNALVPDLLAVQENWLAAKLDQNETAPNQFDYEAESVRELLANFDQLDQWGLAIKIDGQLEGFTIGEPLNRDTAVVHIEKGNYEIRGLYVALCSFFCREYLSDFAFVNREQDLGIIGLRQAKEAWKPDHMSKKYILRPVENN